MMMEKTPGTCNMAAALARVEGNAVDVHGAALVGKPDGAVTGQRLIVVMVKHPRARTMVAVQTNTGGNAADAYGTVIAGRPDEDLIATGAIIMVTVCCAEHPNVWIPGSSLANCSGRAHEKTVTLCITTCGFCDRDSQSCA